MMETPYRTDPYRLTALRFIKDRQGMYGMPEFTFSADFECAPCREEHLYYETQSEFVVYVRHFILRDACIVTCRFPQDERYEISTILCEGNRLPVRKEDGWYITSFEISGLTGATRTLFTHTTMREGGLTLRIEHNAEHRVVGQYAKEDYPATQIQAAYHYMFAMREIARALGIPQYLSEKHLGYLLILGFETCNTIHTDYPPHWHLIYRWPYHCGSQAPHIYLGEHGEMTRSVLCIDGIRKVSYAFGSGEWCRFVDMYGGDVMAICLTEEGGMAVTKPGGDMFMMTPYDEENGVSVYRNDVRFGAVRVVVSADEGHAQVEWTAANAYRETITFDPLTGRFLSAVRGGE